MKYKAFKSPKKKKNLKPIAIKLKKKKFNKWKNCNYLSILVSPGDGLLHFGGDRRHGFFSELSSALNDKLHRTRRKSSKEHTVVVTRHERKKFFKCKIVEYSTERRRRRRYTH